SVTGLQLSEFFRTRGSRSRDYPSDYGAVPASVPGWPSPLPASSASPNTASMTVAPAADGGHDHVPVDGLGHVGGLVADGVADLLEPTPLLLMIDTAVCRPSWACQWPMPARLVILLKRQLSASLVYMRPSSWQNTRLLSCQAVPAA